MKSMLIRRNIQKRKNVRQLGEDLTDEEKEMVRFVKEETAKAKARTNLNKL